jgi:hypothetical protein
MNDRRLPQDLRRFFARLPQAARRLFERWRTYLPAERYRPERHYMRGPGPKSRSKG